MYKQWYKILASKNKRKEIQKYIDAKILKYKDV